MTKSRRIERVERAEAVFRQGFSCSQAVLSVYSDTFGLDREKALKLSQPFGAGMASTGQTCGAVTGALMVIGLGHGRSVVEDLEAKERTYRLVRAFFESFKISHGSLLCGELLGYDLSDPVQNRAAHEKGVFENLCPQLVRTAASILEDLLHLD